MRARYVLGVICHGRHEAAAALLRDGTVIAAAEEERFSRKKFDSAFPESAIRYCLESANITARELSAIGYGFNPRRKLIKKSLYLSKHLRDSTQLIRRNGPLLRRMDQIRADLSSCLGYFGPSYSINHHLCHAASTFYTSPFREASILTLDAIGDWESGWWGYGSDDRIYSLGSIDWPQSIGHVYAAFTEYLGFEPFVDEYKVMALAAYGVPKYQREMQQIFRPATNGYEVASRYFNFPRGRTPLYGNELIEMFGPARIGPTSPITQHYRDIASSLQTNLESSVRHLVRKVISETNRFNLCLAGGVAMNSVANGEVIRHERMVQQVHIPPCASDAGIALGAAYIAHQRSFGKLKRQSLTTALVGPEYDANQIERASFLKHVNAVRVSNASEHIAQLLTEGKIVGWFQGRMEFGQRALGARSILADPRSLAVKMIINSRVKFREDFRPFGAAVLLEHAKKYFHFKGTSPFMTYVVPVIEEMRHLIPAVVHVDGTSRIQTISEDEENLVDFRNLLLSFYRLTGIPLILNTSFNVRGEPIVNTPEEAIEVFLRTDLDHLLCGSFLLSK